MEEAWASLSLIMSNAVWTEKHGWLCKPHFLGQAPEERNDPAGRQASPGQPLPDPYTRRLGLLWGGSVPRRDLSGLQWPEKGATASSQVLAIASVDVKNCLRNRRHSSKQLGRPALPVDRQAALSWPHARACSWHTPTFSIAFASETNLVSDLATPWNEE